MSSQAGQDMWVCGFFKNKRDGFFLDVGAYDPIYLSNTHFLESNLNWNGICIEPNSKYYNKLKQNRKCECVNVAVYNYNGKISFNVDNINEWASGVSDNGNIEVDCKTIDTILKENNAPKIIDYMSLDIEGGEYEALRGINFNEYDIILITVEHNLHMGNVELKNNIYEILTNNGYVRTHDNVKVDNLPFEDWYVLKKYL